MGRSKVRQIWLNRAEGPTGDLGETLSAAFEDADSILKKWARTAPKTGGYDKVDFKVEWTDGEIYEGRYDLKYEDSKKKNLLANHIQDSLLFFGGLRRPEHLTSRDYHEFVDSMAKDTGISKEGHISFLQERELI